MPRNTSAETLEAFTRRQEAATLAEILLELAEDHTAVRNRLVRLQLSNQPTAWAAEFRKTLTGWQLSSEYVGYSQAQHFSRELETWLEQIERELMPQDPAAALALAEAFIETDEVFFNNADDSGACIGEAMRAGCRLWLTAASHCESPSTEWPGRIALLFAADEYGARKYLLQHANLLLSDEALRGFVASYEGQLDAALVQPQAMPGSERYDRAGVNASAAMILLSEALRDPDVLVRTVLKCSPSPNHHQKQSFVLAYLKYDRPEAALPWLEGAWVSMDSSRQRLQVEVLTRIGRTGEAVEIQQRIFDVTLAVSDLHAWLAMLAPAEQAGAIEHAHNLAKGHTDPVVVAQLLMNLDDDVEAARRGTVIGRLTELPSVRHQLTGRDHRWC